MYSLLLRQRLRGVYVLQVVKHVEGLSGCHRGSLAFLISRARECELAELMRWCKTRRVGRRKTRLVRRSYQHHPAFAVRLSNLDLGHLHSSRSRTWRPYLNSRSHRSVFCNEHISEVGADSARVGYAYDEHLTGECLQCVLHARLGREKYCFTKEARDSR